MALCGQIQFLRHLSPVTTELPGTFSIDRVVGAFVAADRSQFTNPASVQVRVVGENAANLSKGDIARTLEERLRPAGIEFSRRDPRTIYSVLCLDAVTFIGVARAETCLSTWSGGEVRFRAEGKEISRAEFKLLEAIAVFNVPVQSGQRALDLGAAPGGWSKVLALKGLEVAAVDPAELSPLCSEYEKITHYKTTAQEFLRSMAGERFDLIVNDMRMDALPSAEVLLSLAPLLVSGGNALMTVKLASGTPQQILDLLTQVRTRLTSVFSIRGARQLFYNRSEITLSLIKN